MAFSPTSGAKKKKTSPVMATHAHNTGYSLVIREIVNERNERPSAERAMTNPEIIKKRSTPRYP